MSWAVIWLLVMVGFFTLEAFTTQMVSIWFAIGALVTMLVAAFGHPILTQLTVFFGVAILLLVVSRPLVKKSLKTKEVKLNLDATVGKAGIVLEEIDNLADTGRIRADGLFWSARAEDDDQKIQKDERVIIKEIRGVYAIVEKG